MRSLDFAVRACKTDLNPAELSKLAQVDTDDSNKVKRKSRIRTARGVVSKNVVSEKPAHVMLKRTLEYLQSKGIQCEGAEDPETDFMIRCFVRSGRTDLKFEAEITAVKDLRNMHALQLRRLQGNAWEWKALVDNLLRGFSIS